MNVNTVSVAASYKKTFVISLNSFIFYVKLFVLVLDLVN